jgi:DNA replication protein DnaC
MKDSTKNEIRILSDAQRHAILELNEKLKQNLQETPYRECSYQNIICDRANLDFLTFTVPHGVDTINKIYFNKKNILNSEKFPPNVEVTVQLFGEYADTHNSICFANFVIPSLEQKIVLSGEAFPIFMFPGWKFSIMAYTSKDIISPIIIQDTDLIIGSIIMSKKLVEKKMKVLNHLLYKPENYKFRSPYIKMQFNNNNIFAPHLNGKNKKVNGENDFMQGFEIDIIIPCTDNSCVTCDEIDSSKPKLDSFIDNIVNLMRKNNSQANAPSPLNDFSMNFANIIQKMNGRNNNNLLNETNTSTNNTIENKRVNLPYKKLDYNLRNVADLLQIIEDVPVSECKTYSFSIDIEKLHKIKQPLQKLNAMVGLTKIKEDLIDWILYFISNLPKSANTQFMNISLCGSPGVGKTHISEILAEILSQIGAIKNNKVAKVSAPDLIGPYVGHSEMLTKNFLKANKGSVIVIDEAYSIARSSSQEFCSYGVKVLDIINQFLSENTDTVMIVCGYKDLLEKYFFNANKGLNRRFPWSFTLESYTPKELFDIMMQKIKEFNYEIVINDSQTQEIIEKIKQNKESLKSNVGDIINIISKALSMHARKILSYAPEDINKITGSMLVQACNNYIDGVRNNNKDTVPPEGFYM